MEESNYNADDVAPIYIKPSYGVKHSVCSHQYCAPLIDDSIFDDEEDEELRPIKHLKYPNIVITEKVMDDWLAKQLGLNLNEIPTTRPPCIPVMRVNSQRLMNT